MADTDTLANPTPADPVQVDPVDEITLVSLYTVTAADGPRRGNLAVLIRYWTVGAGRAKIGWGRPGDFNRCVRRLSKYVPPNQVHGFCARLHKKAIGRWPGRGREH